jgi:hypothetical protein
MILYAASIAAFFLQQAPQPECVVKCVQAAPGSWWDRLLQFLPQLIVSVIPVAGGVWIALWSFHATSKRDHERSVLDQKAVEWRSLIIDSSEALSQIHHILGITQIVGPFDVRSPERQKEIDEKYKLALASGRKLMQSQIFIRKSLIDSQIEGLWDKVSRVLVSISMTGILSTSQEDIRTFTSARDIFLDALYSTASSDLGLLPHCSSWTTIEHKERKSE